MAVTEQQPKIAQDREQPELTGDTVAMGNHDDLKSVRKDLWFGILTLVSLITIPFATPGALLITVAILQFFAMMLYIPGLIYLNYYKIPRTYPHWTRPSNWALAAICISGAFYIVVGIYYLTIKF